MIMQNIPRNMLLAELLLLIPVFAMIFAGSVNWTIGDFVVAGVVLAGMGLAFTLVVSGRNNPRQVLMGLIIVILLIFVWIELAVGIIGSPIAGS